MAPESGNQVELRQAVADLAAVEAQIRAAGIVISAVAFVLSDAMRREAKRTKAERRTAREQARKAA